MAVFSINSAFRIWRKARPSTSWRSPRKRSALRSEDSLLPRLSQNRAKPALRSECFTKPSLVLRDNAKRACLLCSETGLSLPIIPSVPANNLILPEDTRLRRCREKWALRFVIFDFSDREFQRPLLDETL